MNPELLAAWYLRLNGFFTIPSYIVHPTRRGGMVTEVDVAGVRFPFRREFPDGLGGDDPKLTSVPATQPLVLLAEVKTGRCSLNGPWVDSDRTVFDRVVSDLGLVAPSDTVAAAEALRVSCMYISPSVVVRLACIGAAINDDLQCRFPLLPQRTWNHVARFAYERFREFARRKTDNRQWDDAGRRLWQRACEAKSVDGFCAALSADFGVNAA